jgi:hypothetical protein
VYSDSPRCPEVRFREVASSSNASDRFWSDHGVLSGVSKVRTKTHALIQANSRDSSLEFSVPCSPSNTSPLIHAAHSTLSASGSELSHASPVSVPNGPHRRLERALAAGKEAMAPAHRGRRRHDCQAAHAGPRQDPGARGWRQYGAPNSPGSGEKWFGKPSSKAFRTPIRKTRFDLATGGAVAQASH